MYFSIYNTKNYFNSGTLIISLMNEHVNCNCPFNNTWILSRFLHHHWLWRTTSHSDVFVTCVLNVFSLSNPLINNTWIFCLYCHSDVFVTWLCSECYLTVRSIALAFSVCTAIVISLWHDCVLNLSSQSDQKQLCILLYTILSSNCY